MPSTLSRALPAALAASLAAASAPHDARAAVTARWGVDSYEDFHEGETDGALITSLGEIRPGFATDRVDLEVPNTWSATRAPDGTVYLGTDDGGGIYAMEGDGVREVASIPDAIAVVALAADESGALYAGTMPGGAIWKLSPGGEANELASLDDVETVWALQVAGGALYAGTGPNGALFSVDPSSGAAEVVFETGDKRIMSLAATSDGAVWMGTSDQARVYRHVPDRGITRAMADFAGNEVTALAAYSGGVVAAANKFKEPTTPQVKTAAAVDDATDDGNDGEEPEMPSTGSAPGAEKPTPRGAEPRRKGAREGQGALYHVRGDGQLRQLHALTATYISAVTTTDDGRVFAGSGEGGRIYLIDTDRSVSTAIDVPQRLIAQLVWDPDDGLAFTTGDATALYRTAGAADTASYESEVFDADSPSRFGRIAWRSGGDVTLQTRSGNTAEPGPGWSPWQAPEAAQAAGGRRSGRVASPPARYLQYRAQFGGDQDAVLRRTLLYYLPQNRPTRVDEVSVDGHDPGDLVTTQAGSASPRSSVVTIKWSVDNPDGDDTAYTVDVRREGELRWRRLPTGDDPFTSTSFRWNTETFPDGYYRVRVTADDRLETSPDRAERHHLTTPLVLVDNERPAISDVTIQYPSASARASDRMSPVAEMAYSIDDGDWQVGTTRDGIFDGRTEILQIELPDGLEPGVHTLSIRVADEAGNIGSASTSFQVP